MSTQEALLGIRERFIEIEENTYGTPPAFTNARVPGNNINITPTFTQGFQEVLNNGTDSRTRNKLIAGPLGLSYNLDFFPTNWSMLKYVFDIDSETGSDPYTHNLSVGNTLKSFSSEWANRHSTDPFIYQLYGNVINKFTIDFNKASGEGRDGFVKCTTNIIAQDYSEETLEAGSFTVSGDPFQYRHSTVTLAGNEIIPINSGQLQFSQGMNPNDFRYANSGLDRIIGTPIVTNFRITGRFNLNLFGTTYSDLWKLATALTGSNTLVFEQSASNKITFTLTGVYVEAIPHSGTNIEGTNTGDFIFTASGVTVTAIDSIDNW